MADADTLAETFVAEIERFSLAVKRELGKRDISAVVIRRVFAEAEKKHFLGEISSYFRGVTQAPARIEDKWAVSEGALQTLTETYDAVRIYAREHTEGQLAHSAAESLSRIAHVRQNLEERYQEIRAQSQLGFEFTGATGENNVPRQTVAPRQKQNNHRPSVKSSVRYPYADPH